MKRNVSPLDEDPTAVVFKATERTQGKFSSSEKKSSTSHQAGTPSPISARKNIDRQKREQRVLGTVLGGAATTLLLVILVVGALAGLGGYVLWKQIREQSVTVSLLEANLRQEILILNDQLAKTRQQLQKEDLRLQAHLDEQRALFKGVNADLRELKQKTSQMDQLTREVQRHERNINELERKSMMRR